MYSGSYRVHIRGTGGLQIEGTFSVARQAEVASIYIQTNKHSYVAGETGISSSINSKSKVFFFQASSFEPKSDFHDVWQTYYLQCEATYLLP